jgi:ankyrin repeat protein
MKKLLLLILMCSSINWFNTYTIDSLDQDFLLAVKANDIDKVKSLLPAVDVNIQNQQGDTPLFWAVVKNNLPMVQLLLENGGQQSVNIQGQQGYTPLHAAAAKVKSNLPMVQLLLDNGAQESVNIQNEYGYTPLHLAAMSNSRDIIGILLDNGADKTITDNENRTTEETRTFIRDYIPAIRGTKSSRKATN